MKNWGFWTKEKCGEDALKYKSKSEWKANSSHAYAKSRDNGWLKELTAHMILLKKPSGYWTKERIIEDAKKYNKLSDWQECSGSAHTLACKNGWLEEASEHMNKGTKGTVKPPNPLFLKGLKKCPKCRIVKRLNDFYNDFDTKDGKASRCKKCVRQIRSKEENRKKENSTRNKLYDPIKQKNNHLKSSYGITLERYTEILASQNGKCIICDIRGVDTKRGLAVDHDHETGKLRDLLCDKCNRGLGHFNDSPELLRKAMKYLLRHKL